MNDNAPRPPSTLRYFDCGHLPQHLQDIVAPFRVIAHAIAAGESTRDALQSLREEIVARGSVDSVEMMEAVRKLHRAEAMGASAEVRTRQLLEAKDCAVRAMIPEAK